jgi:hypothetical protein
MKKFRGAVVPSTNRFVAILSITFLGFAALESPASPASAASRGIDANCTFVTTTRCYYNPPDMRFPGTVSNFQRGNPLRYGAM